MSPTPETALEHISWSYANLARAHAALSDGRTRYITTDHMIRAKLYRGLRNGSMKLGTLYEDERLKLLSSPKCAYCDSIENLTIDHFIPRIKGGPDDGVNLITACRPCNSSKSDLDLLEWFKSRNMFPRLLLLRRYIKIVNSYCEQNLLMSEKIDNSGFDNAPVNPFNLPQNYPNLDTLLL